MKAVTLILAVLGIATIAAAQTDKVICYYGSWATYRNGNGKISVEDIDPNLCSHIIYSFVGLSPDGNVQILDTWNDVNNGAIDRFINLKKRNPDVKLMVAIGGWNEGSEKYSKVVNSASLRTRFVNSIVSFTLTHKFDGFDLDWEYPAQRGGVPSDRAAFVELLKELRTEFDKNNLILSAAVGAGAHLITSSYDVPNLSKYLDFINLMTYDFHGSWDPFTGQCSPLYASSRDSDKNLNVHAAIQNWIRAGADPKKLILGVALYGRSFTLSNPNNNKLAAPASGGGNSGSYSQEPGMLTYLEICEKQKQGGWTTVWDDEQKNPFTYNGNQWIGYDNVQSVTLKAKYAIEQKLGGVMIWSVESDDAKNSCGDGRYPLLKALGAVVPYKTSSGSGSEPTTTGKPTVTTTTTVRPTEIPTNSPSSAPTPTSTPASPSTTEQPTGVCTDVGFIANPADCRTFYICVRKGAPLNGTPYNCPRGLLFDTQIKACNLPENSVCA